MRAGQRKSRRMVNSDRAATRMQTLLRIRTSMSKQRRVADVMKIAPRRGSKRAAEKTSDLRKESTSEAPKRKASMKS